MNGSTPAQYTDALHLTVGGPIDGAELDADVEWDQPQPVPPRDRRSLRRGPKIGA